MTISGVAFKVNQVRVIGSNLGAVRPLIGESNTAIEKARRGSSFEPLASRVVLDVVNTSTGTKHTFEARVADLPQNLMDKVSADRVSFATTDGLIVDYATRFLNTKLQFELLAKQTARVAREERAAIELNPAYPRRTTEQIDLIARSYVKAMIEARLKPAEQGQEESPYPL